MICNVPTVLLTPAQRSAFLELVNRQFGIRVSDYGLARLDDAVSALLPNTTCTTADDLLTLLESNSRPDWAQGLVQQLTVGETYFLRDPAQIAALRETILPEVIGRRSGTQRLRLWSAGCSTGEEPHTLAILLREQNVTPEWDVMLVGTDVNHESLRLAHEGHYSAWSFRTTPDDIRDRYFKPVGDGWRLIDAVRQMTRFAWLNLGADALVPPATDFDLIICRNVTIYFDDRATQRLYRALISALAPEGWLMLGPSDPLPADREGLERVELKEAVLWRRSVRAKTRARAPEPAVAQVVRSITTTPPAPDEHVGAGDAVAEMESGLLALEAGSGVAVDLLRRAAFRDPRSPLAQFALARAYAQAGDLTRAHSAMIQARRLLAPLDGESLVPGSDALPVETLRQTIQTHLGGVEE